MKSRVPPKAPQPPVGEISHFSAVFEWKEYLDRLKQVFDSATDGRILSELQQNTPVKDEWITTYSGYDSTCTARNLEEDTNYQFRLRFKNKHGWGPFSDSLNIKTEKQPLTGEHIHRSIRMENKEDLIQVLEKGEANVEAQDNLDFTPLMAATQKGLVDFVKILLDWSADVDAKNKSGKTALMLAAFRGQGEVVDVLVDRGAKMETVDHSGLGILHYAVDGEQAKIVKQLIVLGAVVDAVDSSMGWSPLIRCAGLKNNGNVKVAYELLAGKATIDLQDNDGKTSLHNAIINNHTKLVSFLLEKGASIDIKTKQGYNAWTLAESLDQRVIKEILNDHKEKLKCLT